MAGRLAGKRIAITGAVDNIGKEAVRAFVREGAKIAIGDINDAKGRLAVEELGPETQFFHVDVTDETSIRGFIEESVD